MKMRATKTASTRRVEFLSRSTATLEQSLVQKDELLSLSQATKEALLERGQCARRYAGFSVYFLALRRLDPKE